MKVKLLKKIRNRFSIKSHEGFIEEQYLSVYDKTNGAIKIVFSTEEVIMACLVFMKNKRLIEEYEARIWVRDKIQNLKE